MGKKVFSKLKSLVLRKLIFCKRERRTKTPLLHHRGNPAIERTWKRGVADPVPMGRSYAGETMCCIAAKPITEMLDL